MNSDEKTKKTKKSKKEREEEKEQLDEIEQKIKLKSSAFAKAIGGFFCLLIVFVEDVFFGRTPAAAFAAFTVFFAMAAAEAGYRFMFMKKKTDIIKTVICAIFALAFIIGFVVLLMNRN